MNFQFTQQHEIAVYAYIVPVFGLIMLLTLINNNHLFSKKQSQYFVFAVCINLVLIAATCADFLLIGQEGEYVWILRRITSATHFGLAPLLPISLLHLYNRKKLSFFTYIPLFINVLICSFSAFAKIVFFIDEYNNYSRGPLFFLPLSFSVFYILLLVTNPIITRRQGRRRELLYLGSIIALIIAATMLEIVLQFKCLVYGCSAIGLIMYYLLQNIHYFASDTLTGLYNRQMYIHVLSSIDKIHYCVFALVDLNDFKIINDTKGHDAGDKALVQFAATLNKHLLSIADIYRIGGDEFMLIAKRTTKKDFTLVLTQALNSSIQESSLSFAYGMEEYHAGDNVQELLFRVDKAMYEQKAEMKQKN